MGKILGTPCMRGHISALPATSKSSDKSFVFKKSVVKKGLPEVAVTGLGARRGDILRMFLRKGGALAGVGIVAGLVFSASTASMMASLLYGVRPHDPAVFLVAPLLLLIVALLASYIPAWRATKVDPIAALREG